MQKGIILGCGNRSNVGMDTFTLVRTSRASSLHEESIYASCETRDMTHIARLARRVIYEN
jgi:hypothetical protein